MSEMVQIRIVVGAKADFLKSDNMCLYFFFFALVCSVVSVIKNRYMY